MRRHHSGGRGLSWYSDAGVPLSLFQTLFFFVPASVLLLIGITEGLGGRERGKGFCINSCLADSIYKVDFVAKAFVLALKCQNSTVISSAKRRVFENVGAFSHHKPLLWGEEDGIPKNFL